MSLRFVERHRTQPRQFANSCRCIKIYEISLIKDWDLLHTDFFTSVTNDPHLRKRARFSVSHCVHHADVHVVQSTYPPEILQSFSILLCWQTGLGMKNFRSMRCKSFTLTHYELRAKLRIVHMSRRNFVFTPFHLLKSHCFKRVPECIQISAFVILYERNAEREHLLIA